MYKVSIVIPMYNVEKYIVRCAESLFKQTLDDIQFIFVDDASPDNSVSLLKQTLERFPRRKPHTIILHHTQNLGLPTARATGLAYVTAPYVAHCDSDDYVEQNMYEKLYEIALNRDSDMVVCGFGEFIEGREYICYDKPIPNESVIFNWLYGHLTSYVWARLTKTDIYRQIHFPTANFLEDWVQIVQLLTYASRITFINNCLYHHAKNPNSITNNVKSDVTQQGVQNFNLTHDFIVKHHQVKEIDFDLKKEVIRRILLCQIKRKQYLLLFPELNYHLLFNRKISWSFRFLHFLILFDLYPFSRPVYHFAKKLYYTFLFYCGPFNRKTNNQVTFFIGKRA